MTIQQTKVATLPGFPVRKLDAARHALTVAHRRLERAARAAGQEAPEAPIVAPGASYALSQCTYCKVTERGFCGGTCIACKKGHWITREVCDVEITYSRPALAGWDFLAVIEPMNAGANLVKHVPGADVAEGELARYRTGSLRCDHCQTVRNRMETFIVRADGSDAAIPAGTYKQVGRNCLELFLGGKSAAAILWSFEIEQIARDADDGDGGGGWSAPEIFDPAELLSWTAAVIRFDGWLSKANAHISGKVSTSQRVCDLLTPPSPDARRHWEKMREHYRPTDDDKKRGTAALAYARGVTGATDYEHNLRLVAQGLYVTVKHAGILASAMPAYLRSIGQQIDLDRKAAGLAPSAHLGEIGAKKFPFGKVIIERIVVTPAGQWGDMHIHAFRDQVGNAIVWKTSKSCGAVGDAFEMTGTIKAHSEFRGEKQTEVTRPKLVKVAAQADAGERDRAATEIGEVEVREIDTEHAERAEAN